MSDLDFIKVRDVLHRRMHCNMFMSEMICSFSSSCCDCPFHVGFSELHESLLIALKSLDKQIPERAVIVGHNNSINTDVGECPVCNGKLLRACDCSFCPDCGQRLDWS